MIKLNNPYTTLKDYRCFGCSPDNAMGLRMEFFEEGDEVTCSWVPDEHYQGFPDILHGGIQATMMDEIASWVVFIKLDTAGVTYTIALRYRKPVSISKGPVKIRAWLTEQKSRVAGMEVKLYDGEGTLCTEGRVEYFLLPPEKARIELRYPGKEAFYKGGRGQHDVLPGAGK